MVIKVIYKGKKKEKWKGKCDECGSIMEADEKDLEFDPEESGYAGGLADCPVCNDEETTVLFYPKKEYDKRFKGGK